MSRGRDERGIALPSPITMLSLAAVGLAGVAFVATSGDDEKPPETARSVAAAQSPTTPKIAEQPVIKAKVKPRKVEKPKPEPLRRGDVFVEVYNNSGITGLASATADTIAGAGWLVVGADNWYGTIQASTVYYPERLHRAARLLAKDLGVNRIMPSISPMRFDRLTVILTTDYS